MSITSIRAGFLRPIAGFDAPRASAAETPAEHPLRVRAADMPGSADFSRLAADYQLARHAEVSITRENHCALGRLDRLRHLLRGG